MISAAEKLRRVHASLDRHDDRALTDTAVALTAEEIKTRILEALLKVQQNPSFSHMSVGLKGLRGLTKEQNDFVKLWIEEALRASRLPTHRQQQEDENEALTEQYEAVGLSSNQQLALLHLSEPGSDFKVPGNTLQALQNRGLVSFTQRITSKGLRAVEILKTPLADRKRTTLQSGLPLGKVVDPKISRRS